MARVCPCGGSKPSSRAASHGDPVRIIGPLHRSSLRVVHGDHSVPIGLPAQHPGPETLCGLELRPVNRRTASGVHVVDLEEALIKIPYVAGAIGFASPRCSRARSGCRRAARHPAPASRSRDPRSAIFLRVPVVRSTTLSESFVAKAIRLPSGENATELPADNWDGPRSATLRNCPAPSSR